MADAGDFDVNGYERPSTADSRTSEVLSDDDQFFDAVQSGDEGHFGSASQEASLQMIDNLNNQKTVATSEILSPNGCVEKRMIKTHYENRHKEVDVTREQSRTHVVDDEDYVDTTIMTNHGMAKIYVESKFHSEKTRRGIEPMERETSSASSISDTSRQFQDCPQFIYRKKLPVVMFSRDDFSFWGILKQCIGKELSKITMPVVFNEPLSFLQRLCEYMEYTYLIKKACSLEDPVDRLQTVAAFSVSALASQLGRVGKPYNPLLGETFEFNRPDLGFHWVSEQVSHHPPISAFHATGTNKEFDFHGSVHPKLKFWGKSVEVEPKGVMTLTLNNLNETYTWSNPHASVQNVVVGKPWIEQHGGVEIMNHSTKDKCVLNFKSHSWFKSDINKVEGYILNPGKKKVRYLEGDWTTHLFSMSPEAHETYKHEMNPQHKSGKDRKKSSSSKAVQADVLSSMEASLDDCVKIWEAEERPSFSKDYYSFTSFAMTLNELTGDDKEVLPPTDTRHRPDIRCQEDGSIDGAGDEKWKLEEKQRAVRKSRTKSKEEWRPRWFRNATNPVTQSPDWIFDLKYKSRGWTSCPDIF